MGHGGQTSCSQLVTYCGTENSQICGTKTLGPLISQAEKEFLPEKVVITLLCRGFCDDENVLFCSVQYGGYRTLDVQLRK